MRIAGPLVTMGMLCACASAGVVGGQIDDFQDGTTQGWGNPVAGTFANTDGGPLGVGDRYLRVSTNGNAMGPGSTPAVFNTAQWSGDYITAGITSITMDIANFTPAGLPETELNLRLLIFAGGGSLFTTTATVDVTADGVWRSVTFDISEAGVTQVDGGFGYLDSMTDVTRLLIRHQPGAPAGIGGASAFPGAIYGMDNIRAVPSPATLTFLALAGVSIKRRRR